VVLVDVGTVVVLTTSHTATTGRLAVLANTTFTGRHVAAVLAGLGETGRHCGEIWRLSSWFEVVAGQTRKTKRQQPAEVEILDCGVGLPSSRWTFPIVNCLTSRAEDSRFGVQNLEDGLRCRSIGK
jgi:hypothetical protein